jgi:hypothetical protein
VSNANAALGAMVMFLATFSDGGFVKLRRLSDRSWSVTIHAPARTAGVTATALTFDADSLPVALNDACVKFFARMRYQAAARRPTNGDGAHRYGQDAATQDVEDFLAHLSTVTIAEGDEADGDV